jgi:hypothetical protein
LDLKNSKALKANALDSPSLKEFERRLAETCMLLMLKEFERRLAKTYMLLIAKFSRVYAASICSFSILAVAYKTSECACKAAK